MELPWSIQVHNIRRKKKKGLVIAGNPFIIGMVEVEARSLMVRAVDMQLRECGFESQTERCVYLWAKQLRSTWPRQKMVANFCWLFHTTTFYEKPACCPGGGTYMPINLVDHLLWARCGSRRNKQHAGLELALTYWDTLCLMKDELATSTPLYFGSQTAGVPFRWLYKNKI